MSMRRVTIAGITLVLASCGRGGVTPLTTASDRGSGSPSASATAIAGGTASATPATVSPQPEGSQTPEPKPTVHPREGSLTIVTESDAGSTFHLRVGDRLEVRLPAEYITPSAHPAGVLTRTSSTGGYPSSQPLVAFFSAGGAGRADVDSTTDAACLHATPQCMIPQRLWSIHVVVTA